MKLALDRTYHGVHTTLGMLWLDGAPLCFTLEDERRDQKVPGETRIPEGTYALALRREGGMHKGYAAEFPDMHKGMLWLKNVPGFDWIYLHVGNTERDTAGCPLVGLTAETRGGEFTIGRSRDAYRKLYPLVAAELLAGRAVEISVTSR